MDRKQQNIQNCINKSDLDSELKRMFSLVFAALQQEQEETLENLKLRIQNELMDCDKKWETIWNIKVYLAEDENEVAKMEQQGFQVIDAGNTVFIGKEPVLEKIKKDFLFFDGTYEDFLQLLQNETVYLGDFLLNNGRTVKFKYRIRPNYRLVRQEKILCQIARIYNIQRPVVFSPYARRAVDIEILWGQDISDSLEQVVKTDLKLKDNGLDVIREGFSLMWNISLSEGDMPDSEEDINDEEHVAPDGDRRRYTYVYWSGIQENDFVYPVADLAYPEILKHEKEIRFICENRLNQYNFKKIRIHNQAVKNTLYTKEFYNAFDRGSQNILRIRTAGDIQYVLSQFLIRDEAENIFWCDFDSMYDCVNDNLIITRYIPEHDYWNDGEQMNFRKIRNRPFCYVKFFCQENRKKFLTDYANYVLHYLNYEYPEYCWAGVQA